MTATGRLTTHVLDTMSGRPAAGVKITLHQLGPGEPALMGEAVTNGDGRCDGPLLSGDAFTTGEYELLFHARDYFHGLGVALAEPAFLDKVPIRFGIAEAGAHYHVPLLISPYAYSTYRGS